MKRNGKISFIRKAVQAVTGLLANGHFAGFVSGKIYQGPLKRFCVPGMNCYACPGALGACPIGALQASLSARKPKLPFYVLGFMMAVGVLLGRFVCGWLCLFGLIQELLYMIPTPKLTIPEKADKVLRYLKYVILAVFVVLLPLFLRNDLSVSYPYFCKWVCPVGTLEGGIPLVILDKGIRQAAHFLFAWKLGILGIMVLSSVFIYRPFCKYICPLGAFYALFQKVGFTQLKVDTKACVGCGHCADVCKMGVNPSVKPDSAECIRCGKCVEVCPRKALSFAFAGREIHRRTKKPDKTKAHV
ncbi:MAG: 4Fe-4S binding protein [Lachnospiraceae bacterium]|nr:4Fe-4S binding protein [Lachnospiraceae bacterium]